MGSWVTRLCGAGKIGERPLGEIVIPAQFIAGCEDGIPRWKNAEMCHNPAVDYTLLGVIAVVASAVLIAVAAWIVSGYRQRKLVQDAREWLLTEATINSGALESMQGTNKAVLPTFAFSYQVSGEYYSGKFSLMPKRAFFPSEARRAFLESMIEGMIGRKLSIRYNPRQPDAWFIPEERIGGCKVEQRIGSHMILRYYPLSLIHI